MGGEDARIRRQGVPEGYGDIPPLAVFLERGAVRSGDDADVHPSFPQGGEHQGAHLVSVVHGRKRGGHGFELEARGRAALGRALCGQGLQGDQRPLEIIRDLRRERRGAKEQGQRRVQCPHVRLLDRAGIQANDTTDAAPR